ncbi:MAG: NUDIX hydrolase [bacterium]|nr:NUDIX hydrolase [bacterium]
MDLTEKFVRGELVFEGRLLKVHRDVVQLPDGHEEVREVMRHPGAAVVIPYLDDGRIVMVRQYRYALSSETLELPAGKLDSDEDPLVCARRELSEETGYEANHWTHLFCTYPAPGYTDELLWIYLAEDLIPGPNHPDPDEQLLVVHMPLEQALLKIKQGQITDCKTLSALLFLQVFHR